jgi:hypothetical protein
MGSRPLGSSWRGLCLDRRILALARIDLLCFQTFQWGEAVGRRFASWRKKLQQELRSGARHRRRSFGVIMVFYSEDQF